VHDEAASLGATPEDFGRVPFAMMDILRRSLGNALGAFGLDPDECPYRIVSLGPHCHLRDYGGHHASLSLLIVAGPIKRAYIWDLAPSVSAVRYCMREGLHVHLLEWMPASQQDQNNGLDEYTEAISECVAKISRQVVTGLLPTQYCAQLGGSPSAAAAKRLVKPPKRSVSASPG
jgi:polyhydroxyalkanoate synthase